MNLDMQKVEQFAGQVVTDISATFSGVMTNIGHKLGLYKAMAGCGAMSSQQLARKTGTHERYVREWLNNQTAGGYVLYDQYSNSYTLPDEHIPVLVDEDSPLFLVPALEGPQEAAQADSLRVGRRSGEGLESDLGAWHNVTPAPAWRPAPPAHAPPAYAPPARPRLLSNARPSPAISQSSRGSCACPGRTSFSRSCAPWS